jgi:hypothetical protein
MSVNLQYPVPFNMDFSVGNPLKFDTFKSVELLISDKFKKKNYNVEPLFSYVKGTIDQIYRIGYSNVYIKQVISHIIFVLPETLKHNFELEIKANKYNYIVIIHGFIDMLKVSKFMNAPFDLELVYFRTKINSKTYKLHICKSFISTHNLVYSSEMFNSIDEGTNNKIINVLQKNKFDSVNYCFIGGDSISYCHLFDYEFAIFYIDSYMIDNYFMENIRKHKIEETKFKKKYVYLDTFDLSFHLNNKHNELYKYSIVYEINDSHNYYNIIQHLCKVLPQYLYLIIPSKLRDNIPFVHLSNAGYTITHNIYIDNSYSPVYIIILS